MSLTDKMFEEISDEEILRKLGLTLTDWRHKFVNLVIGYGPNLCGGIIYKKRLSKAKCLSVY